MCLTPEEAAGVFTGIVHLIIAMAITSPFIGVALWLTYDKKDFCTAHLISMLFIVVGILAGGIYT